MPEIRQSPEQYHRNQCVVDGRLVQLTTQECDVLSILLARRGASVPVAVIRHGLWPNPDNEPGAADRVIQARIGMLRRLLGRDAIETVIQNPGTRPGYRIPELPAAHHPTNEATQCA